MHIRDRSGRAIRPIFQQRAFLLSTAEHARTFRLSRKGRAAER
jgi:hypothetical protein